MWRSSQLRADSAMSENSRKQDHRRIQVIIAPERAKRGGNLVPVGEANSDSNIPGELSHSVREMKLSRQRNAFGWLATAMAGALPACMEISQERTHGRRAITESDDFVTFIPYAALSPYYL